MSSTTSTAASGSGGAKSGAMHDHPLGAILLGLVVLFFALWGVTVQLTTSESWFIHGSAIAVDIAPHFGVLAQPWDFFQGKMAGMQAEAFTYAWGSEVVQFLFSTGLVFSTLRHNRIASWICIVASVAIMILDSVSDYFANNAANGWQQLGFTVIVFMMAFGLLYYALHLLIAKGIIAAIHHWWRKP